MCVVEITLRTPSPATASESLVGIEFQRLGAIPVIDVEPQVVTEMCGVASTADRSPIKFVGIRMVAGQSEFSGRTIERWGLLMESEGGDGHAQSRRTRGVHDDS